MKILRFLFALGAISLLLITNGCSDVKNRAKEQTKTVDDISIALTVKDTSTTDGASTSEGIDESLEGDVTKTLTRALIKGSTDTDLFADGAAKTAESDFPDNTKAKANKVEVSFHAMKVDGKPDLIVADITQSTTAQDSAKNTRTGKIYFNNDAKIVGYSFPDTAPATTENLEESRA